MNQDKPIQLVGLPEGWQQTLRDAATELRLVPAGNPRAQHLASALQAIAEQPATFFPDTRPLHVKKNDEPVVDDRSRYFWRNGWNALCTALRESVLGVRPAAVAEVAVPAPELHVPVVLSNSRIQAPACHPDARVGRVITQLDEHEVLVAVGAAQTEVWPLALNGQPYALVSQPDVATPAVGLSSDDPPPDIYLEHHTVNAWLARAPEEDIRHLAEHADWIVAPEASYFEEFRKACGLPPVKATYRVSSHAGSEWLKAFRTGLWAEVQCTSHGVRLRQDTVLYVGCWYWSLPSRGSGDHVTYRREAAMAAMKKLQLL